MFSDDTLDLGRTVCTTKLQVLQFTEIHGTGPQSFPDVVARAPLKKHQGPYEMARPRQESKPWIMWIICDPVLGWVSHREPKEDCGDVIMQGSRNKICQVRSVTTPELRRWAFSQLGIGGTNIEATNATWKHCGILICFLHFTLEMP